MTKQAMQDTTIFFFVEVSILRSGFSLTIYLDDLRGNNEVSSDFSEIIGYNGLFKIRPVCHGSVACLLL